MAGSGVSFSGIASGIDTESLISATISAKRQTRITPLENKISEAEDETSAMEKLKDKFLDLKELLGKYTTLQGGAVKKQAASSDETVISATATNAANLGKYEITTTSLAQQGVFTFGKTYSATSDKINASLTTTETITLTVGTGASAKTLDINIDNTTSLSDIYSQINDANIGCEAVYVNIGTSTNPQYTIMISSLSTGTTKGSLNVTTSSSDATISEIVNNGQKKEAADAVFSVAGLASNISRETNAISDLIPGVTFNLVSVGTTTISVENDMETTEANVQEIFDAINDIISFTTENDKIERKEDGEDVENVFAALSKTRVDNMAVQSIKDAISACQVPTGTYVRIFADMGITTNAKEGTFDIDIDKFEEVFAKEPNSVNELITEFADNLSLTGGTIDQYTRYNGMFDMVINSNNNQITDWNDRISRYEAMLDAEEQALRSRYANFETLMSKLQTNENALAALWTSNNN